MSSPLSSNSSFTIAPNSFRADVLGDAKAKAKELENQAKSNYDKASDKLSKEANKLEKTVKGEYEKAKGVNNPSGSIELYSFKYYYACAFGGLLACGLTHAFVTPLDLVKCRRQADKSIYKGNFDGWKKIWTTEGGIRGIYTGVGPTLVGYSVQGSFKYGFYEYFKKTYSDMAGPEAAHKYKDAIYLAGSASAEFLADMAFVPFEAVKVRMQTTIPPYANSIVDGMQKFAAKEGGYGALYKSLTSLWSRQIPYTMMKFWSFEATVSYIYGSILGKPKDAYNKAQQLAVSAAAGYWAGIFCAVISHPADNLVSKLNAPTKDGTKPAIGAIFKEVGMIGLMTNGLPVRIVMIGTLTALQWGIYDAFKVYNKLPTTGGAAPPPK